MMVMSYNEVWVVTTNEHYGPSNVEAVTATLELAQAFVDKLWPTKNPKAWTANGDDGYEWDPRGASTTISIDRWPVTHEGTVPA
jgi:hypothetical protein